MCRVCKWIEGVEPDEPVSEVARRAIAVRLQTLLDYLPLAAKKWAKDTEHVHQLRVATRRAKASLDIFADCLPEGSQRAVQKQMRRLRQAAGAARDLDVLDQQLRRFLQNHDDSRLGGILDRVARRRAHAQQPVLRTHKKLKKQHFREQLQVLVDSIGWYQERREPRFAEAARSALRPIVNRFFQSADELADAEALHRMRIRAKQVRYAIELLAGAFDTSFRQQLYPTFEEVQEQLGGINDRVTAMRLFAMWIHRAKNNRIREELARLIGQEANRCDAACCEFRAWWTKKRRSDLKQRFEHVLAQ